MIFLTNQQNVIMILQRIFGISIILFFFLKNVSLANCDTSIFYSQILKEVRKYTIHLPKNNEVKNAPIVFVLDDLGAITSGINQVNSNFERSIDAIIIEIHSKDRYYDYGVQSDGNFVEKSFQTNRFFIEEFFPFIDSIFSTSSKFRIAVGHSMTASFWNSFAINNPSYLNSLILISPYLPPKTLEKLNSNCESANFYLSYYLSYAENDLSGHLNSYKSIKGHGKFSNIRFKVELIKKTSHTTLLPQSIQNGIIHTFYNLQALENHSKSEIKEMFKNQKNKVSFVDDYYKQINKTYFFDLNRRKSDIEFGAFLINKWGKSSDLLIYCNENLLLHPKCWILHFYLGEYYEKMNLFSQALENYQLGYDLMVLEDEELYRKRFLEPIKRVSKKLEEKN